eukprot:gene15444-21527_t
MASSDPEARLRSALEVLLNSKEHEQGHEAIPRIRSMLKAIEVANERAKVAQSEQREDAGPDFEILRISYGPSSEISEGLTRTVQINALLEKKQLQLLGLQHPTTTSAATTTAHDPAPVKEAPQPTGQLPPTGSDLPSHPAPPPGPMSRGPPGDPGPSLAVAPHPLALGPPRSQNWSEATPLLDWGRMRLARPVHLLHLPGMDDDDEEEGEPDSIAALYAPLQHKSVHPSHLQPPAEELARLLTTSGELVFGTEAADDQRRAGVLAQKRTQAAILAAHQMEVDIRCKREEEIERNRKEAHEQRMEVNVQMEEEIERNRKEAHEQRAAHQMEVDVHCKMEEEIERNRKEAQEQREALATHTRFLVSAVHWSRESRANMSKVPPLRRQQRNSGIRAWHSRTAKDEQLRTLLNKTDEIMHTLGEHVKEQRSHNNQVKKQRSHNNQNLVVVTTRGSSIETATMLGGDGDPGDQGGDEAEVKSLAEDDADRLMKRQHTYYDLVHNIHSRGGSEGRAPPGSEAGTLRCYQLDGLKFMAVLPNWCAEFEKWTPGISFVLYDGNPDERKNIRTEYIESGLFNVILTHYDLAMRDKSVFKKFTWETLVVDEGHRLKNADSKLFEILSGYQFRQRLLLTGTPVQNTLSELWALLNFLLPKLAQCFAQPDSLAPFAGVPRWVRGSWWVWSGSGRFGLPAAAPVPLSMRLSRLPPGPRLFSGGCFLGGGHYWGNLNAHSRNQPPSQLKVHTEDVSCQLREEEQLLIINRLHQVIRPFMLRRTKCEVEKELPNKTEHIIKCAMSAWQQARLSLPHMVYALRKARSLRNMSMHMRKARSLPNMSMQLRKARSLRNMSMHLRKARSLRNMSMHLRKARSLRNMSMPLAKARSLRNMSMHLRKARSLRNMSMHLRKARSLRNMSMHLRKARSLRNMSMHLHKARQCLRPMSMPPGKARASPAQHVPDAPAPQVLHHPYLLMAEAPAWRGSPARKHVRAPAAQAAPAVQHGSITALRKALHLRKHVVDSAKTCQARASLGRTVRMPTAANGVQNHPPRKPAQHVDATALTQGVATSVHLMARTSWDLPNLHMLMTWVRRQFELELAGNRISKPKLQRTGQPRVFFAFSAAT